MSESCLLERDPATYAICTVKPLVDVSYSAELMAKCKLDTHIDFTGILHRSALPRSSAVQRRIRERTDENLLVNRQVPQQAYF